MTDRAEPAADAGPIVIVGGSHAAAHLCIGLCAGLFCAGLGARVHLVCEEAELPCQRPPAIADGGADAAIGRTRHSPSNADGNTMQRPHDEAVGGVGSGLLPVRAVTRHRREGASAASFSILHCVGTRLVCVESVNAPLDHMAARKLLEAGKSPEKHRACEHATPLKAHL